MVRPQLPLWIGTTVYELEDHHARPVHVVVLGSGSWGTTVAALAAHNTPTLLWARDPDTVTEINERRRNSRYLGDRELPDGLRATTDIAEAAHEADVLVVGVPSHAVRTTLEQIADRLRAWVPILSLAKGLEPGTRLRPTQVVSECLPGHPVGLLSGPNIAGEIADGKAAATVVAMQDDSVATALQPLFASKVFRVYRNTDVLGCELGGVLKNIVAIAAGMAEGLGVGDNTRAMVLTRGLAEMTRLGEAMGATAYVRGPDRNRGPDRHVHEPGISEPAGGRGSCAWPDPGGNARRTRSGRRGRENRTDSDGTRARVRRRDADRSRGRGRGRGPSFTRRGVPRAAEGRGRA